MLKGVPRCRCRAAQVPIHTHADLEGPRILLRHIPRTLVVLFFILHVLPFYVKVSPETVQTGL